MSQNFDEYYQAIINKDAKFEGIFITAVKTTGIFCRPTCTARKPKRENVEFYKNTKEAVLLGYRPCKVCKPLESIGETPQHIRIILAEINKKPFVKIKDSDLKQRGIEPNAVRRWFLKHHGMTFQFFQRKNRINAALKNLQCGETVTEVAYNSGFESLSGFGYSFKKIVGHSPKISKKTF